MEPSKNIFNVSPENLPPKQEDEATHSEFIEFVPKFDHIKEDLEKLFNIEVTSEATLHYPSVKNEMYAKVIEDLQAGKPFALDYMFEEGLLTKNELRDRGIEKMKPQAEEILRKIKGPIGRRMKDLIVNVGILTEEEANSVFTAS